MTFSNALKVKINEVAKDRIAAFTDYSAKDQRDWKTKFAREIYWAIVCEVNTPEGKELGDYLSANKAKETARQVKLVIFN